MSHHVLFKSLNLVTYITAISTIYYYREFIGDAILKHPNYLTNSEVGYVIPAINWFLLGGFNLVQWLDFAHDAVVEGVSWHLFVSNLIVASWVLTWRYNWLIVGQILLVINAILVWRLFIKVRVFTPTNLIDYAFVHISFSLYSGLVWLDVFQNFFAAFTSTESGPESLTAYGAAFSVFVLLAIGSYHAEFSRDPDSWSAATIALMLLSIGFEQRGVVPIVEILCFISFGWLVGALARRALNNVAIWNERALDDAIVDGERQHLLG